MWDCPSLGTSLPSAIAYGGCIVWGVELSLTPGLDWAAPSDVQHGVYQLLIGDDLDTLRDPHAPVALKALALADIVLIVFPPEKVAKAGVIGIKLIRGILDIARVPVDDEVIRAATDLVEHGGQAAAHYAACFPAGTLVATPGGGEQAIQTLQVGDPVLSENPNTGEVEAEPVQAVIADPVSPLVAVELSDGSAITATADHPFWVEVGVPAAHRGAWVDAGQLRPGLRVRTAGGSDRLVTGVKRHAGYAAVYTLTVAHDHTFFVGQARVLVHNANGPGCFPALTTAMVQLQKEFKHASDFGIQGNWNPANGHAFAKALEAIVNAPTTRCFAGTYRGEPVIHNLDPATGLDVLQDPTGRFISGWKLSPAQLQHVLTTGRLGGG